MAIRGSNILKPFTLCLFFDFGCSNTSETKKYTIGFSQTGINDEWRKSMNQAMKIQTAYLGADNYQVGTNAANYLASLTTEPKNIIEIRGLLGSSPASERSYGFNNIINYIKNLHE